VTLARPTRRLTPARLAAGVSLCAAAMAAAMLVGLLIGSVPLDFAAVWAGEAGARTIFFDLRLPRVLLAALAGAALATSGAALQPTLRNPLASPEIIGVSGGAALAAVVAIALLPETLAARTVLSQGLPLADWVIALLPETLAARTAVPLFAFGGAAASSVLVYRLAHVRGRLDPYTQVLLGVIFNTFAAALILLLNAIVDLQRSHSIVFWMMGGITIEPYSVLAVVAVLVV